MDQITRRRKIAMLNKRIRDNNFRKSTNREHREETKSRLRQSKADQIATFGAGTDDEDMTMGAVSGESRIGKPSDSD